MAGTFTLSNKGKVALLKYSSTLMPPVWTQALRAELEKIANDPEGYTALILTSTDSKVWHQGLDLKYIMKNGGTEPAIVSLRALGNLAADLMQFPMPVIAAMNGHAFAGGAVMALACDQRVMRKDRGFFCMNEVDVPLMMPAPAVRILEDKLSRRIITDLICRGKRFNAEEALKYGLVDTIADEDELIDKAVELAESIGEKDRFAYSKIKSEMYRKSIEALRAGGLTCEEEAFPRGMKIALKKMTG